MFLLTSVFNHANYPDSKALLKIDFIYLSFECFWQILLTYFYFTENQSKFIISYLNIQLWHGFIVHVFLFVCFFVCLFSRSLLLRSIVFALTLSLLHYDSLLRFLSPLSISQHTARPLLSVFMHIFTMDYNSISLQSKALFITNKRILSVFSFF